MHDFKGFVRQHLASLAMPRARELKIVEELSAQIEESYDSLIAEGLSDEAAWNEVQRHIPDWKTFGDELLEGEPALALRASARQAFARRASASQAAVVLALRDMLAVGLVGDLRSSVRLLLKARGFAATTTLTLAVCLGANAAVFTVVNSVLLRPLPVPDSDRIVALGDVYPTITPNDILSNTVPVYMPHDQGRTSRFSDLTMIT